VSELKLKKWLKERDNTIHDLKYNTGREWQKLIAEFTNEELEIEVRLCCDHVHDPDVGSEALRYLRNMLVPELLYRMNKNDGVD